MPPFPASIFVSSLSRCLEVIAPRMASTVAWWLVAFLALARLAPVLALDSASSTSLAFRNDLGRVVNLTVTVPPSSEPVATIARLTEGALSDAVTLSLPLNATSLTVKPILTFLDTGERIILAPKEVSLGHAQGVLAYRHALVSWYTAFIVLST